MEVRRAAGDREAICRGTTVSRAGPRSLDPARLRALLAGLVLPPTVPVHRTHFADGGYAGGMMALTLWRTGTWQLQIVKARPS